MFSRRLRFAGILVTTLFLALLGCGGGSDEGDTAASDAGSPPETSVSPTQDDPFTGGPVECWVNDEPIFAALVDRVALNMSQQGAPPDPDVGGDTPEEKIRNTARKVAVDQKLALQSATADGFSISDEQVELQMGEIISRMGGIDNFRAALTQQGVTEASVRREFRDNLLVRQYIDSKIDKNPAVSEDELVAFYDENAEQFGAKPQVHARHILFAGELGLDDTAEATLRGRVVEVQKLIEEGADFAEMAGQYSEGPSKVNGGDLDWFERGAMVPPFDEVVFSLKPGEVSGPVRTRFGYHLIKVEEVRTAPATPFAQAKNQIQRVVANQKILDRSKAVMDSLRAEATIRNP